MVLNRQVVTLPVKHEGLLTREKSMTFLYWIGRWKERNLSEKGGFESAGGYVSSEARGTINKRQEHNLSLLV